jgi:hypothetical protein
MTTIAPPRTFTSREVCDLAAISYRQLDYAVDQGWFAPATTDGKMGSGHHRVWSEAEAVKVVEVARMVRAGISIGQAVELVWEGKTAALLVIPLPERLT